MAKGHLETRQRSVNASITYNVNLNTIGLFRFRLQIRDARLANWRKKQNKHFAYPLILSRTTQDEGGPSQYPWIIDLSIQLFFFFHYQRLCVFRIENISNNTVSVNYYISVNQSVSGLIRRGKHIVRSPYNAMSGSPSGRVSMHASFPARVPPGRIYRLAESTNYAGVPVATSILNCFWRRPPD